MKKIKTLAILLMLISTTIYPTKKLHIPVQLFNIVRRNGHILFTPNSYDNTPLHYAVMDDNTDIVKQLCIDFPKLVTLENSLGCSVLHYALKQENSKLFKFLIRYFNADEIKRTNTAGFSPRDIAKKRGFDEIVDIIDNALDRLEKKQLV